METLKEKWISSEVKRIEEKQELHIKHISETLDRMDLIIGNIENMERGLRKWMVGTGLGVLLGLGALIVTLFIGLTQLQNMWFHKYLEFVTRAVE